MARPSSELFLAWSALSNADVDIGWRSISLQPTGGIDILAGRKSPENVEAVLFRFPAVSIRSVEKLPEGVGFSTAIVEFASANQMYLALSRKSNGSIELFASMACDVINTMDEAVSSGVEDDRLASVCINRIAAWQEFMRKGADGLTPEEELGLVGEIELLKVLVENDFDPITAISSWIGPLSGIQDFQIGSGAIEVKATLSSIGFLAKIGSLDQLDDSVRQPLFLAAIRFVLSGNGKTLPQLINCFRELVRNDWAAKNQFSERLLAAGFFDSHEDKYNRKFSVNELKFLKVGEGFPRLTQGSVPVGVRRVVYEIDIDRMPSEGLTICKLLEELGI